LHTNSPEKINYNGFTYTCPHSFLMDEHPASLHGCLKHLGPKNCGINDIHPGSIGCASLGWHTASQSEISRMEELLTVRNSRTHRSKQEEIFVGEHKTYTMDAFRWQVQPGDKPREFFAGTKVTCLNKLGMREEGLTLFVYCGGKLTSGSKLIIVLFSLFPMRFEIPCLKNPDDCRTEYPIQKCSVSIWQLVSKMCPVLEWIRERHTFSAHHIAPLGAVTTLSLAIFNEWIRRKLRSLVALHVRIAALGRRK